MFVGLKLVEIADDNKIAVVLTVKDLALIEALLSDCPYRYASPLMVQLVAASERQQSEGVLQALQRVVEDRNLLASMSHPATSIGVN